MNILSQKKEILYLINSENIFRQFCENVYNIKYQKYNLSHMYFLIFLYQNDKFVKVYHIDEVFYTKLSTLETNLSRKLRRIVILGILYNSFINISLFTSYICNIRNGSPKCTKHYPYKFFKKTIIQENCYFLHPQRINGCNYEISLS